MPRGFGKNEVMAAKSGSIIAKKACPACGRTNPVKVNKSGWPYVICPQPCGHQEKAQSNGSARVILNGAQYVRGERRAAEAAYSNQSAPAKSAEPTPEKEPVPETTEAPNFLEELWG